MQRMPDELAAERGAVQFGLVTHAQLRDAGLTQRQIDGRVRSGRLRRVHVGVFAIAGAPATFQHEVLAAVLAGGVGAVASHSTAAALWGLPEQPNELPIEITSPRARCPETRIARVHRSLHLDDRDVTSLSGIPCTTIARCLVDLSAVRGVGWLARAMDDSSRRNRTTVTQIRATVDGLRGAPGRRPSVLRMLVDERLAIGTGKTESWLERTVLGILLDAGVPPPVEQFRITASGHEYRLDFAWPEHRLALEVDGYWHGTYAARQHDRARDLHLRQIQWTVLRVTDETPAELIVSTVRGELAR